MDIAILILAIITGVGILTMLLSGFFVLVGFLSGMCNIYGSSVHDKEPIISTILFILSLIVTFLSGSGLIVLSIINAFS